MAEQTVPTAVAVNKINANPEFKITLVAGGADVSNIYLKGYRGNPASQALPAGVTLTSDIGDSAGTLDYFMSVPLNITRMVMQTDNVANYQEKLVIGQYLPPFAGQVPSQRNIELTKYRQSTGNGYSDVTLPIEESMQTSAQFFIKLSKLKANSTLNIYVTAPNIAADNIVPVDSL